MSSQNTKKMSLKQTLKQIETKLEQRNEFIRIITKCYLYRNITEHFRNALESKVIRMIDFYISFSKNITLKEDTILVLATYHELNIDNFINFLLNCNLCVFYQANSLEILLESNSNKTTVYF